MDHAATGMANVLHAAAIWLTTTAAHLGKAIQPFQVIDGAVEVMALRHNRSMRVSSTSPPPLQQPTPDMPATKPPPRLCRTPAQPLPAHRAGLQRAQLADDVPQGRQVLSQGVVLGFKVRIPLHHHQPVARPRGEPSPAPRASGAARRVGTQAQAGGTALVFAGWAGLSLSGRPASSCPACPRPPAKGDAPPIPQLFSKSVCSRSSQAGRRTRHTISHPLQAASMQPAG